MDYTDKCEKPMPVGPQKFAYQCENVVFEPIHGKINIRGYVPFKGGKEPYPNEEKGKIENYDLEIGRFTGNAIEIIFIKRFKDKSEKVYLTNMSFAHLVNAIFDGNPANIFDREAPVHQFKNE